MLILLIKFKFTIVGQGKSIIGTYHLKIFTFLKFFTLWNTIVKGSCSI